MSRDSVALPGLLPKPCQAIHVSSHMPVYMDPQLITQVCIASVAVEVKPSGMLGFVVTLAMVVVRQYEWVDCDEEIVEPTFVARNVVTTFVYPARTIVLGYPAPTGSMNVTRDDIHSSALSRPTKFQHHETDAYSAEIKLDVSVDVAVSQRFVGVAALVFAAPSCWLTVSVQYAS